MVQLDVARFYNRDMSLGLFHFAGFSTHHSTLRTERVHEQVVYLAQLSKLQNGGYAKASSAFACHQQLWWPVTSYCMPPAASPNPKHPTRQPNRQSHGTLQNS